MRTYYEKNQTDMLREAYLIIVNKLYIFIVCVEKTNCYIFIRKYVHIKSKKLRWYHANSLFTLEIVRDLF